MWHRYSYFLMVAVAVGVLGAGLPSALWAQEAEESTVRTAGTVANLFETIDPGQSVHAVRLNLPQEWTLEELRVLRYGTESVALRQLSGQEAPLFLPDRSLRGPHEVVLRVRMPETTGTYRWGLDLLRREEDEEDPSQKSRFREVWQNTERVDVESPRSPDRQNHALTLEEADRPLLLRAQDLPAMGRMHPFTIEFWVQTSGLDEVILSTWNGKESVSYPVEFVVDRAGRLRFYSGRPGNHQALQSRRPVADGRWHHVAAVYDAQSSRLRLLFDGVMADSLRDNVPPSSPGPVPIALGGRVNQELLSEEQQPSLFSGRLDEVRIWGTARSVQTLQRMKNRQFKKHVGEGAENQVVRLGFDTDETDLAEHWPDEARRVPTSLAFQSSLRNLSAQSQGRSVTLQWAADASNIQSFTVERSTKGKAFTTVAELSPENARTVTPSEVPTFSFTDEDVPGQIVFYRIRQTLKSGVERTSGTIKIGLGPEDEKRSPVELIGNFPNPFTKTTTVAFEVNEPQRITLTVWNLAGHQIAQLVDGSKDPGYHEVAFEATDLPSGTYFVRLKTPTETLSHRMVVLK